MLCLWDVAVPSGKTAAPFGFYIGPIQLFSRIIFWEKITWAGWEMEREGEYIGSPFMPFSKECPEQPWDSFLAGDGWWKKVKQIVGASSKNRGRYWARECYTLLPAHKYEAVLVLKLEEQPWVFFPAVNHISKVSFIDIVIDPQHKKDRSLLDN